MKLELNEKNLMVLARGITWFFNPLWLPTIGVALLFLFSYLKIMPMSYKFLIVVTVFCFTVMMPHACIFFYRRLNGWSLRELSTRENRIVPYLLSLLSYVFCLIMLYNFRVPGYMTGILVAAIMAMLLCTFFNLFWKVSSHMTSVGALIGGLACFGELFSFNPIWWMCLALLLGGIVGTSRMILRQHTLAQVLLSVPIGFVCSFIGIFFGQFIIDYIYYIIALR